MSITAVNAREKYALKKLLARCDQKQEFLRNGDGLLALIATMMDELVFRKELGVGARGKAHLRSREWLHIKSRQIALQLSHDIFGSLSNWLDAMFRGDQKLINILEEALYPFFRRAVNLKAHLEVQSKQGPYTTSWPPYHMKASWGEHEEYDFFEQWSDVDCLVIDLPAFTELASHEVVGNPVLSARNVDEEGDEVLQEQVYMALCGPPDQRQQDDEARTQESQTEVHGHRNALVASPSPARSPNGANQSRKHGLEGQEQAGPHVPYKKMKFASAVPPGFFSSDSQRTDHGSPEAMGSDQILKWSSDVTASNCR